MSDKPISRQLQDMATQLAAAANDTPSGLRRDNLWRWSERLRLLSKAVGDMEVQRDGEDVSG